jgi:hypothetical protein
MLEFNNGAISSYVTNGQLVIAREPLGSNEKNEAVGKDPVYSPEFAKDRRVEIKIEKIK